MRFVPIIFVFALLSSISGQQIPASSSGVTLATDVDCIVALDDKVVGRVQKDHKEFFPAPEGKHTLSAATDIGDYWEQSVEITTTGGPSVIVSFVKVRADRAALEKNVGELREKVDKQEKELASSQAATEKYLQSFFQPAMISSRRHSIVAAVNSYTDRWGKELGMRDSRYESSQNLDDAAQSQYLNNLGNPDQTAQAVGNLVALGEMIAASRIRRKAERNSLAAEAASARMEYLGKALEDPLKFPPDKEGADYLAVVSKVKRNRLDGELITAPDRIEYSDSSLSVKLSCSMVRSAGAGKELHLSYSESRPGTTKMQGKSLVVQGSTKNDGQILLGNVYLACPKLTE